MQFISAGKFGDAEALCGEILEKQPNNAEALHTLGLTHYMTRRYDQAIEHMSRAVQFDDSNPQFFCNLGESFRRAKKPDEAIEMFEKALALKPEYLLAHLGTANSLRDLGKRTEAIARYRLTLALNPSFAEAYFYLGSMFLEQDRKADAIALLRKAMALKPSYREARIALANALDNDGQIEEAKEAYRQLIKENKNFAGAYNNLANILKSQGEMDEAISLYEEALKINPSNVQAHYNLSRTRKAKSDHKEIARLESMLEAPDLPKPEKVNIHFSLGKIYDDLGRHDDAFKQYKEGNSLDERASPFNPKAHKALVERLKRVFNKQRFARCQGFGSESKAPVFVVGLPRSGTTLIEQVLAGHPDVFGAGELDQISRLINAIPAEISGSAPYPESAGDLDAVTACRLGESYITYTKGLSGGSLRTVDKMPANFMHLGFISLMLPNARIIHSRRQPMDSCLSCYFQHFTTPMPFSNDLKSLGQYYQGYENIMDHWRKMLPLEILDVQYEDMIFKHEETCRRIVDFCGLEWDKACLQFQKSKQAVKTASSWQVRQPLYGTSVARWRKYESSLAPLKESLGGAFYEISAEPVAAKSQGKPKGNPR